MPHIIHSKFREKVAACLLVLPDSESQTLESLKFLCTFSFPKNKWYRALVGQVVRSGAFLPDFIIASPKLEFQPIIGFYEV